MTKHCDTHMRIEERKTRSLGLAHGYSLRTMARVVGRAPSTVSREAVRNARGQMPNMMPIAAHPAEMGTRTVPGHGEGALITGARHRSAIGALVERTTRMVILATRNGTDAASADPGFTTKLRHVPTPLRTTRTSDRGHEMAEHERLAHRLAIQGFFAEPHSPWQRGINKNATGLLRQSVPNGTDLSGYTQRELNALAHRLDTRPRKCLNVATPREVDARLRHHSPAALGTGNRSSFCTIAS